MNDICSTKDYENDILQRQRYVRDLMAEVELPAGQTTQLVVGASLESDREIFERMIYEYKDIGIRRIYFSAFCPQKDTAFENREAQPLWREHRLYQMDWLYRVYRFVPGEIAHAFNDSGFLINRDPKLAIARQMIDRPMDPNDASYKELIKVPGIGPISARRIIAMRRKKPFCSKAELAGVGVVMRKAGPFMKINGWRDATLDNWLSGN
jgi:predicted DNA-binding helix-hairpin-helix protein